MINIPHSVSVGMGTAPCCWGWTVIDGMVLAVFDPSVMSVAVTVFDPAVFKVTLKVFVPATSAASVGNVAAPSLEVMRTV